MNIPLHAILSTLPGEYFWPPSDESVPSRRVNAVTAFWDNKKYFFKREFKGAPWNLVLAV